MLLSLPYLHDTIKLASPKFPKPVISFLIANVFTSAIKNVMTGLNMMFLYMYVYTLRNEGSSAVLKEPLGFFCETKGSFDGVGFF